MIHWKTLTEKIVSVFLISEDVHKSTELWCKKKTKVKDRNKENFENKIQTSCSRPNNVTF